MTFPQPNADEYCVNGYDFFRLKTKLACPGDLYESAQSSYGVALGPDSDIANVNIAYFDEQMPNYMGLVKVSPDRGVVGLLNANNLATYAPANRPAKILAWPDDLWNPAYVPGAFVANITRYLLETPTLDLFEYFSPQESLVPKRNDKEWFYQELTIPAAVSGAAGKVLVAVPFYGRKYASVLFHSIGGGAGASVDIGVFGVTLLIDSPGTPPATPDAVESTLASATDQSTKLVVVDSCSPTVGGMFDLLLVSALAHDPANQPAGVAIKIITSDTPGGG